jgi:predicted ATPase/tRNA A-37 threonylcarbamoyl transferase component Bud32
MIGQTIAHYHIIEQLGQGGMGVVYKAEDTRLQRTVALKFLPEALRADSAARAQFLREARAASRLKHPNVLTIYTVEESQAGDFIAMEYAERGTLRERLGSLSADEVIAYMLQAAGALQAAHDHGIIHRDIKPDNLLIDSDGNVRISDFGLARMSSEVSGALHSDVAVGTAHYMSPEQVTGANVDARSDIFSLGVTFFELLAGRRPFEGDYVMSVLYAIANDPAPRVSEFVASVSEDVEAVIARCLAKNREDRYESCRQFLDDLNRLQGTQTSKTEGPATTVVSESHSVAAESRPLVGRQTELEQITRRLKGAITGSGFTLFLTGESGVGKSRLAEAVMSRGRELGMGVLAGRCLPQGGGLPFHPYTQALRNGLPRLNEALVGPLEKRANALGIDLRNRMPILKSFLNMSGPVTVTNQEQLWDSLLVLLRVISAERPVVLYLDDLQWADDDTLRFFGFVARNAPELPLIQIATYRSVDGAAEQRMGYHSITALVRQLHGDGFAELLEIARLSASDTLALASDLLGQSIDDPELTEAIVSRTDGNPLFVHELIHLIRQLDSNDIKPGGIKALIPGRVRDIVAQRIEKLETGDRDLLELASCETELFDSDVLAECLNVERIPLLRRLQKLEISHRLIRHDGSRYRFDHPLIRDVIYGGILPELRVEYHRMISQVLITRHRESAEHASRIAHHLIASNQKPESVSYLLRAADRARDLCANSEAHRLYEELEDARLAGVSPSPNDEIRLAFGMGDVLLAKGRTNDAKARYERGLQLSRSEKRDTDSIEFEIRLSAPYRVLGDLGRARDTARSAVEQARAGGDHKRSAGGLAALAMAYVTRAEYEQAIESASELLELAVSAQDVHLQSVALSLMGAAHLHQGNYRQAAISLDRAIEMQRTTGDQKALASSLNFAGLASHRLARFSRSVSHHHESLRIKQAIQDVSAIPGSMNALGDVYRDMGQIELAFQKHTESLELARKHSNRGSECDNLRDLGVDHMLMGQTSEARAALDEVLRISTEHKYPWYETRAYSSYAELCLKTGELDDADRRSQRAMDLARQINSAELMAEAMSVRANVLAVNDAKIPEAVEILKQGIAIAEAGGLALPLRAMQMTMALLLKRSGDAAASGQAHKYARKLLEEAAGSIDDTAMRRVFLETPQAMQILKPEI